MKERALSKVGRTAGNPRLMATVPPLTSVIRVLSFASCSYRLNIRNNWVDLTFLSKGPPGRNKKVQKFVQTTSGARAQLTDKIRLTT
jgi:hypothetical protein